jgi:prepilin-type N-terminal cleavage/methylation domain-containing protein
MLENRYKSPGLLRRPGGYTLLEVLIVMGLIGVFVAMMLPDFNRVIPEMKVNKAANKLAADLRFAQQTAITEMSYVRFLLNPAGLPNGYRTEVWNRDYISTGVPGEPVEDPLKGGSSLEIDFNTLDPFTSVVISLPPPEVRFTPLGTIVAAGDIDIQLVHSETGYSRTVRVKYPLGKVELLP